MKHDQMVGTAEMLAQLRKSPEFAQAWNLEEPKIALAANVVRLRAQRGLTQKQLAEAAGMKQPRIAEIERGDANPRLETLVRIALALGVDVADLHARVGPPAGDEPATQRGTRKDSNVLSTVVPA